MASSNVVADCNPLIPLCSNVAVQHQQHFIYLFFLLKCASQAANSF